MTMTSTTVAPPCLLPGWLKNTLLAGPILAMSWCGAIAYWRIADHAPGMEEMALVLLGIPMLMLLAAWAGKQWLARRPAAAPGAGTEQAAQAAQAVPPPPPLAILAAALRAPLGDSPQELAEALAGTGARPDLDPELVDADGFPVTSARIPAAHDDGLQDEMREWLAAKGMAELQLGEAHWRALTLGTAVVRELAQEAMLALYDEEGAMQLRLLPLLPAGWTVEQRHAAGAWFKHTLAQAGWPLAQLTRIDMPGIDVTRDADLALLLAPHEAQVATLIVACDSSVDQDTVDAWSSNGTLYGASRAQGRIPGEGAAGLLLTGLSTASRIEGAPFGQLTPVSAVRREIALDSARRPETRRLAQLADSAARAAGIALADVVALAADTDHRSNRTLDLMSLASSALPELDTTADILCSGVALGSCGAVPAIGALALARHAALVRNAPVLFVSNDDPFVCRMALVLPPPAPAPVQPA